MSRTVVAAASAAPTYVTTTVAPAAPNRRAMAPPMYPDAPVTSATLPAKFIRFAPYGLRRAPFPQNPSAAPDTKAPNSPQPFEQRLARNDAVALAQPFTFVSMPT